MQRSRLLILVGLLLLLATAAAFFLVTQFFAPPAQTPVPAATPTEVNITQIVIAVQPLPRGSRIPIEAIATAPWPTLSLPTGVITDTTQVIGKIARFDLVQGVPILSSMIASDVTQLGAQGSEDALRIPPGQVAVALPVSRLSSVGYRIKEGDHVNVLVSLLFVDVQESTQTALPSNAQLITVDPTTGGASLLNLGKEGDFSTKNLFSLPIYITAAEAQRPRLVSQQIVQDAIVLGVGGPKEEQVAIAEPTATPNPNATTTPEAAPTPIPPPDIITLVVSPQDSVVLKYFLDADASFTLALRSAGDASRVDTESVTLQYNIERFRISVPTPLPYSLEPAIRNLTPPTLANEPQPVIIPLPDGRYICAGANCPPPQWQFSNPTSSTTQP